MKTSHKPHITSFISNESNQRILSFLKQHTAGTLSTVTADGDPHGAVIYYSIDDEFIVRFTTKRKTRKFDNLTFRNRAMLVVYEASSQTTVQVMGIVEEISNEAEAQAEFKHMIAASMDTSETGLPPISKLYAGAYVAMRLKPLQIRMAIFARPDPGGYDMYESIEFGL